MSSPFPTEAFANGHIVVAAFLITATGRRSTEAYRLPINYTEPSERGVLVDWSPEGIIDHIESQLEDHLTLEDYELRARVDPMRPELEFDFDREDAATYSIDLY